VEGFVEEWEKFYKEHSGWFDRFWYSAYEKTVEFRKRLVVWRRQFIAQGGSPAGPTDTPPETAGDQVKKIGKWLLIGGAVLVGLKIVDYLRERGRVSEARAAGNTRRALNAALSNVAHSREARAP
jgi:hypothetical protein